MTLQFLNITQHYQNAQYYSTLLILLKITDTSQHCWYYSILPILLNITNITQFYLLTWSWSDPELLLDITQLLPILHKITNITNLTQYYTILHNIANLIFTNIHQYYTSNITQYSIGGIQYKYYSILPILLNINITQYS